MLQTLRYNVTFLPVLPFRCGHVCRHAIDAEHCRCPDHLGTPRVVLIDTARERGQACGPEATHMTFKGV